MPDDNFYISVVELSTYGHTAEYRVTPERRLWLRVLEVAMEDMQDNPRKLLKWVETDNFKFICKAVGCRPAEAAKYIREIHGEQS